MKKILISLLVVGVVSFTAVKAAGAFFTDTNNSTNNTFTAGTLNIDVLDQNQDTAFQDETLATNWQPGESVTVSFDVKNSGNVPLQLRGYAAGTWNVGSLDPTKVKVTRVERWNGAVWEDVIALTPAGITGFFYYTNTGTDAGTFFDLAAGERAQLRLTVKLDETADNSYQTAVFTSTIHAEARQTTVGATWP